MNNFVVLARYHYYDGVPFHRIVPGFVDQAGDPVGPEPGTGGPGLHDRGRAPGRSGHGLRPGHRGHGRTPEPDSGGSQFFFVVGDPNGALSGTGTYAVFGKITEGQDVSEAINAPGHSAEQPTKPVADRRR